MCGCCAWSCAQWKASPIKQKSLRLSALALIAGALFPFGLAPFEVPLASIFAVGLLSLTLSRVGRRGGFLHGYLFGLAKYGVGASWIYVSIHVYGNAPPLLAGLLVAIFVAGLAILPGLFGWLMSRFFQGAGPLVWAFAFALLWTLHEWVHMWLLTGFPWLLLGYAGLGTPVEALAPIAGVLLVSFASALSAASIFSALRRTSSQIRLACAAIAGLPWLLATLLWPIEWTENDSTLRVALAQGSVPQALKWQPEHLDLSLDAYDALMDASWDADLIVLPEAAIPLTSQAAGDYLAGIDARADASDTAVIIGIPRVVQSSNRWVLQNTAQGLGLASGIYAKRHLVPFGEYVPLESLLRGLIGFFDLPMSHAMPGPSVQPPLRVSIRGNPVEVALAICYEIAYPNLVSDAAPAPGLLVTISNDAWFGRSIGPWQHLEMARMRALEQGRYLLRATNNGVTAVVAPDGRIVNMLEQDVREVLRAEVGLAHGETPYKRFGQAWLIILLGLSLAGLLWHRAATPATPNQ